jgi:hypothetical protein
VEDEVWIDVGGGVRLEARLGIAEEAAGSLVVCHPHPLYGGDMDNPVVVRAAEVARESRLATLRFNFRGAGRSTGAHDQGRGERDDLRAAIRLLREHVLAGRPVGVAGYSFGAWVAARAAVLETSLSALCLIGPPLAMLEFGTLDAARQNVLLVAGTRDPYCPVADLLELGRQTPGARVTTIEGADHFFFGKLYPLGEALRSWVREWVPS